MPGVVLTAADPDVPVLKKSVLPLPVVLLGVLPVYVNMKKQQLLSYMFHVAFQLNFIKTKLRGSHTKASLCLEY